MPQFLKAGNKYLNVESILMVDASNPASVNLFFYKTAGEIATPFMELDAEESREFLIGFNEFHRPFHAYPIYNERPIDYAEVAKHVQKIFAKEIERKIIQASSYRRVEGTGD